MSTVAVETEENPGWRRSMLQFKDQYFTCRSEPLEQVAQSFSLPRSRTLKSLEPASDGGPPLPQKSSKFRRETPEINALLQKLKTEHLQFDHF